MLDVYVKGTGVSCVTSFQRHSPVTDTPMAAATATAAVPPAQEACLINMPQSAIRHRLDRTGAQQSLQSFGYGFLDLLC